MKPKKMFKIFYNKLKNRLSKSNNGIFKNYLYELSKDCLKQVHPILPAHQELITQNNYQKVLEIINIKNYKESFKKNLEEKQIGMFAFYQNQAIGYSWAHVGSIFNKINSNKKIDNLIKLKNDESFIHICRTGEKFRGKKIYPFLLYELANILFSEHKTKKIFIDTDIKNIPSQKGIEKIGFKKIYLIKRFCFLGFFLFWNFKKINKNL